MSTKLPVLHAHIEKEIKEKMIEIAKKHDRSLSKEIQQACRKYIEAIEKEK